MKTLFCTSSAILILMSLVISCEIKTKKPCNMSWEFTAKNPHDTVNKTDCNGLKQGKWIPSVTNQLKDTVFYTNDLLLSN